MGHLQKPKVQNVMTNVEMNLETFVVLLLKWRFCNFVYNGQGVKCSISYLAITQLALRCFLQNLLKGGNALNVFTL